jgi:hypothetical protein
VVNPYEPLLSYEGTRLSLRREQPKFLNLIVVAAFLRQMQRAVKHDPLIGDYIEATLDDIAVATDLAHQLFGQSVDDHLSPPSRALLGLIAGYARQCGGAWEQCEFSRRQLREAIGWSDPRLRAHLGELVKLEYLATVCGGMGSTFRYRLLIEPDAIDNERPYLPGLKAIEQLQRDANLAGLAPHPAGQNGDPAATPQAATCEVAEHLNSCGSNDNGHGEPNLAAKSENHIYELAPPQSFRKRNHIANGAAA